MVGSSGFSYYVGVFFFWVALFAGPGLTKILTVVGIIDSCEHLRVHVMMSVMLSIHVKNCEIAFGWMGGGRGGTNIGAVTGVQPC